MFIVPVKTNGLRKIGDFTTAPSPAPCQNRRFGQKQRLFAASHLVKKRKKPTSQNAGSASAVKRRLGESVDNSTAETFAKFRSNAPRRPLKSTRPFYSSGLTPTAKAEFNAVRGG
ncbi:MAG: hypothetical protein IJO06_10460 [Thermoguttaceae bacterium]|nr:hypothetical protein [Thermoguttaceae bacterium]